MIPTIECKWCFIKGWSGFATPFFIVVKDKYNYRLTRHELCHVRQWWRYWIVGFMVLYLYYLIKYGYWNNPFEVEARNAEV